MTPNDQPSTGTTEIIAEIVAGWDAFMQAVAGLHAPGILGLNLTMSQAKVLHLLSAEGPLGVGAIAGRLAVTASTASELIDKLVDHGLLEREHSPSDRRHLSVSISVAGREAVDRFQELGRRQLAEILASLDADGLVVVRRAVDLLIVAATLRLSLERRKEPLT